MVVPKRNRNRNKNNNNNTQAGSVGVLDGGGAARRQPRHQYQTRVRFLRQLNVMSQRLVDTITGNIDTIDSPRGDYTSFFMATERGPTMVVSHAGSPDRATGDELVGDLQQIYGYGADGSAPSNLLMHVDAGEEAGAREAAQAIIDRLNAERGVADQLVLREDGIENTSGGTRSLSFRVERAGAVAPVGGNQPGGDGQPVGDGQPADAGQRPGDGQQPDARPPDDGPPPDDDGPPPVGDAPAQQPLAADPPDDPDADLRTDVPLRALPTVEAFRGATRERSLRGRTAEYERVVSTLDAYQRDLTDYAREAQVVKGEVAALGDEKTRRVEELIDRRGRLERQVLDALSARTQIDEAWDRLADDMTGDVPLDDQTRATLERTVTEQAQRLGRANNTAEQLRQEIADAAAEVQRLDGRLESAIALNKQVIRRYEARLGDHGAELATAAKGYLDSKKHSARDPKQIAVRDLLERATDPDQNLQRLKNVASEVWGSEFRNQLDGPTRLLNTGTASDVFRVHTYGEIGASRKRDGFAKRAVREGEYSNSTTENLQIPKNDFLSRDSDGAAPLTAAPNLIARQVVSSRLARELELDVIADEVFSTDADGRTIGVTAEAPGRQVRREDPLPPQMVRSPNGEWGPITKRTVYPTFTLTDPRIQRNLSNLQVMDALTGQKDRHLGNVFIDGETGRVVGIDNDMAFGRGDNDDYGRNELPTLVFEGDTLTFKLDQIDRDLAARILDPGFERVLLDLMRGNKGDPERLAPELRDLDTLSDDERASELAKFPEVQKALERLTAVRNRINELAAGNHLDANGEWTGIGLVGGPDRPWGTTTHTHAITRFEGDGRFSQEFNYLVRAKRAFDGANDPNDPFTIQEVQGGGG